jgi:hypothetical protein
MSIEWHRCLGTGFPLSTFIIFNCFVRKEGTFWQCLVDLHLEGTSLNLG